MSLPPLTCLRLKGKEERRNGRREEGSVVGRKRERGSGREVGVKAGMEEMGRHCAWEDGSMDGGRGGRTDGMEGDGVRD